MDEERQIPGTYSDAKRKRTHEDMGRALMTGALIAGGIVVLIVGYYLIDLFHAFVSEGMPGR